MPPTSSYYDAYWSENGVAPTGTLLPAVRRVLDRAIPDGAACLDLGCGDGRAAGPYLVGRGCNYLGADVSANALDRAAALGLETQLISDASALPWAQRTFDAVVSFEVLEHLFDPMAAAHEVIRVLRPGGTFVLTVPNAAYWTRRIELGLLGRWNPLGDTESVARPWRDPHIRFFTTGALRRFLSEAGFERVEVHGHSGAALAHFSAPWTRRHKEWRPMASPLYRLLERRWPGLFGYGLCAVARRPADR